MEAKQWRPTGREQSAYTHLLALVDPQHEGVIRGQAAVPFFQKSGLPDAVLGGIWQLADTESKGHLSAQEFSVAMKLISLSQAQRPVALANLGDETGLPELRGISWQHILGSPSATSLSGTHGRRDSNTSSIGWGSVVGREGLGDATISAKEKQQYVQIFEKSNPVDGAISGAAARALFTKTKLTAEQLGRVWALADPQAEGRLRQPGFIVAMYFIRRIMENRGLELPQTCPAALWRSAGGDAAGGSLSQSSLASASTPDLAGAQWDVTKEEWTRYEQFFNSLDTQRAGTLSGDVPVNFFLKSKLPEGALSKVWDLADVTRSGRLNKEEFAVAMHLINAQLAGVAVPDSLPPTLVPPSRRRAALVSSSMHNLSPTLRPLSTKDRLQLSENLKRSTSYAAPSAMSRAPTNRSAAALSPTAQEPDLSGLQNEVSEMEDFSRGLQTQRTATANQLALAGTRKQELEVRLAALQSSHDVELRINQELQDKLKGEEARVGALQAQVGEANKRLAVVSAQHGQLEQDVHRVQTQQAALAQRLQQAQDDERQLNAEIAALEQRKSHLEQTLAAAQSQIRQQQQANQELAARADALKGDVTALTQQASEAEATAEELAAQSRARAAERQSLSFDDIFGTGDSQPTTGDSQPLTAEGAAFSSSSGEFLSARTEDARRDSLPHANAVSSGSAVSVAASLPAVSSAFAAMPSLDAAAASSGPSASVDAFDSFGAHSSDPFEEFLQSAASPSEQPVDALFAPAVARSQTKPAERSAAARAASDPRSVTSTPAPSSHATPGGHGKGLAKSTPSSPPLDRPAGIAAASTSQGFAADFNTAFGMLPSTSERAINQDIEAFETKFPEIGALSVSDDAGGAKPAQDEELTFESVFGSGDDLSKQHADTAAAKSKGSAKPPPASMPARTHAASVSSDAKDSDSKSAKTDSNAPAHSSEDDFVPPPVVKRTNVSARPMSRVLSIFRSSSSSNTRGGGLLSSGLAPKQSANEKRRQHLRDQDKKFEEQWARGDWPEWVKKGEYFYERKMLLEMGYPKDRVVEALEVNDFNLAQATDYLLSS